ncbi:MAG: PhzF family phenazine biosynthesis protein [Acidimicrobiales bacterium]
MPSASFPYTLVDVFTDTALGGNGLAVVHDADGLDEGTMLRFAREVRLSETTFVQSATEAGADYRNRIWTTVEELPFAGHPSLGTAVALARRRLEHEARYVQQTQSGHQPIEVHLDGTRARAIMTQPPGAFGAEADSGEVMAAVGLRTDDAHVQAPQVVSTGLGTLIAPVAQRDAVTRAVPDFAAVDALLEPLGVDNLYLAWPDPDGGKAHARMFSHFVAGGEDPATGSAAGALCAYLAERLGWPGVEITQGLEMGRPSHLRTEVHDRGVQVGGDVVVLIEGTLFLDTEQRSVSP